MVDSNVHRFLIEDAHDDDNDQSIIRLSSTTMDKLELFCGDPIKLKGKRQRYTICVVIDDDTCQHDRIRIHHQVQNNLRVYSEDFIEIETSQHLQYGKSIDVTPFDDTIRDDLFYECVKSYFKDSYRPVTIGDKLLLEKENSLIEFQVVNTEPNPSCIVAPETIINCDGQPIEIDFDDIAGLEDIKQQLTEFIQAANDHQLLYSKFGIRPSRGILLYGPSGCGKTMLVKAIVNEYNMNIISIKASQLLAVQSDHAEANIRQIFDRARQSSPCFLLFDQFDQLFTSEQSILSDRLVNQILTEIDGISLRTKLFFIATTNRPLNIDRTFFRPDRFDQQIYVPLPDEKDRQSILRMALRFAWSLSKDVNLTFLTGLLVDYSAADIIEYCRQVYEIARRQPIDSSKKIHLDHFLQIQQSFKCSNQTDSCRDNYERFARMYQSPFKNNSVNYQLNSTNTFSSLDNQTQQSSNYTDDDDLYG